jgi:hypothetical protein
MEIGKAPEMCNWPFPIVFAKQEKKNRLGEVAGFFALLRFLSELQNLINDFNVRKEHSPATVAFHAQAIQDVLGVFARPDSSSELFPFVADEFAAGEASNGDNHRFLFSYL